MADLQRTLGDGQRMTDAASPAAAFQRSVPDAAGGQDDVSFAASYSRSASDRAGGTDHATVSVVSILDGYRRGDLSADDAAAALDEVGDGSWIVRTIQAAWRIPALRWGLATVVTIVGSLYAGQYLPGRLPGLTRPAAPPASAVTRVAPPSCADGRL